MSLLDTLKAKLNPELFAQVTDALGDDFDYDLVTRSRLNTVIGQREAARRAIQRQQQTSIEIPGAVEDPNADVAAALMTLLQSFGSQQTQVPMQVNTSAADILPGQQRVIDETSMQAKIDEEVRKQVNQVKQQYAITEKLREAGAVDPSLILNGGLLDQTQLKWSATDPSKLESGLDEQLTALKEQRAYLFQAVGSVGAAGTGRDGNPGSIGTVNGYQDFMRLPYEQQLKFKQDHPEAVKGFMDQMGIGGLIGHGA